MKMIYYAKSRRVGLGKNQGSGYKNILPTDKKVHEDAGRGIKQPQKVGMPIYHGMNFRAWQKEHPNFMTPDIVKVYDKGDFVIEVSEGTGIGGNPLYGVSYIKRVGESYETDKTGEKSKSFSSKEKALQYAKVLASGGSMKSYPVSDFALYKQDKMTENEVNLVKKRLNSGKLKSQELWSLRNEEPIKLSEEQSSKGLEWLNKLRKTPTGKMKQESPFGNREDYVLDNFDRMEVIDFQNDINISQQQAGISNYKPVFRVIAKDGASFEYYAFPNNYLDQKILISG